MVSSYPNSQMYDLHQMYDFKNQIIQKNKPLYTSNSLMEIINEHPDLSIFCKLIKKAKYENKLSYQEADFTLFVTSDEQLKQKYPPDFFETIDKGSFAGIIESKLIIKLAYRLEKFIYKKAKLINVLTPAFRDVLINKKNIDENKIIFIPNAADFTLSDVLLRNFDIKKFRIENELEGRFVITYVGAHGLANHLDQVLETAKLLHNTNVLFLLIGDGMEKPRLIQKAKYEKIQNVRFINPVPKADVFKYILASEMGASVLKNIETANLVYQSFQILNDSVNGSSDSDANN
jgi:glycosyltransferase involved in cell wall biosynthesis